MLRVFYLSLYEETIFCHLGTSSVTLARTGSIELLPGIAFPFDLCQPDSGFVFKYLGAGIRRHWHITYPPGLH